MRISWQIYPLDFVLGAKLSLDSHFPNSKTPGKQENYSVKIFCSNQIWQIHIKEILFDFSTFYCFRILKNSILLYKFVKFGVNKRFDTIIFLFSRRLRVWKMRIEWQFCPRDEVEGVNLSQDSQFFKRDDSVKMEIYSGKPWVQPICQIYIT